MEGPADGPIIVVGAGVAGLACAGALAAAGRAVTVLERARGVGGRCATRRVDGQPVDSGPAFLHGRDPAFLALLDAVPGARREPWPARISGGGDPCQAAAFEVGERRVAFEAGVGALPRHLARGLDVRLEAEVTGLEAGPAGALARTADGAAHPAAAVILACAPEQSARLLEVIPGAPPAVAGVRAVLGFSRSLSCLSLLAVYPDGAPAPDFDVLYPRGSPLQLVSSDGAKRAAGARTALTLQARPAWSRERLDDPAWPDLLLAEAARLLGPWAGAPAHRHPHRWRYARQDGAALLSGPVLLRLGGGWLGLCGDRFGPGGGVEGAWRSGRALAERLLAGR